MCAMLKNLSCQTVFFLYGWNLSRTAGIFQGFRVREEINLHFQESSRPYGKARGGQIAGYLTDEQRSQAGWIGALKCEVIFERALRRFVHIIPLGAFFRRPNIHNFAPQPWLCKGHHPPV